MSLVDRVAANLRQLRTKKGWSQLDVARRAGHSVSYESMLERGQRSPPLERIEALAKALKVSPIDLVSSSKTRH